jgi:hypothetical protein
MPKMIRSPMNIALKIIQKSSMADLMRMEAYTPLYDNRIYQNGMITGIIQRYVFKGYILVSWEGNTLPLMKYARKNAQTVTNMSSRILIRLKMTVLCNSISSRSLFGLPETSGSNHNSI